MNKPNKKDYMVSHLAAGGYGELKLDTGSYAAAMENYCDHLEIILRKIIEDKVADDLLRMQCQVSPEDFDKLVEKRFNKLINEVNDD